MKMIYRIARILAPILALSAGTLKAQLTVEVRPGYQFSANERLTATKLNMLGQPNISVAGTVSGTVGLAANSVSGVHLANSVVDGTNTEFNAASPRQIRLASGGVDKRVIATNIAGAALSGGAGSALAVQVDGATIGINGANQLTLVQPAPFFTNAPALINSGSPNLSYAHGLTRTPFWVRWVMVCQTQNLGYVPGDEVGIEAFTLLATANTSPQVFIPQPLFVQVAGPTHLWLTINQNPAGSPVNQLITKTNGLPSNVTLTNWKAKVYAQ